MRLIVDSWVNRKVKMRRGYKTWAEDIALKQRELLQLQADSPLPARSLAEELEIAVVTPNQIPGI